MTTDIRPSPAVPLHLDADTIGRFPADVLVDALAAELLDDSRPGPGRLRYPTDHGELLLMPAANARYAGTKVLGLAGGNASRGLPTISGLYILMDAETLRPVATLDGAALTSVRTPAVSALAVRHLASRPIRSVVVFGSGPQAEWHLNLLHELHGFTDVVVVGRNTGRAAALAGRFAAGVADVPGVSARAGTAQVSARAGTPADVRGADLVLCCSSSREPLFDASLLAPETIVVAVGSHHPDARELGADVMAGADVVVESRASAETEAGDVMQAIASGDLHPDELIELAALVRGEARLGAGGRVFKSVGMAWEDLAVAAAVYDRAAAMAEPNTQASDKLGMTE